MIARMDVIWNPPMAQAWARFHRQNAGSLQQSWAYGEALRSLGVEVQRVVAMENGQWLGCAQWTGRRLLAYLSLASCSRGPVFDPNTSVTWRAEFIRRARRELPLRPIRIPLLSPNQPDHEFDGAQVQGTHRVMTGYSTVMLDLRLTADELRQQMDGKWRNRLVRAESMPGLKVFFQPSRAQLSHLLEKETQQRKVRGFFGLPTDFVSAYVAAHDKPAQSFRLAWAETERRTVAAMLFLLHGSVATYHVGWADDTGRDGNAHNLLLWRAMQELPACGIEQLDLGGVNTRELPGISRFKLGAGGRVLTLPGTFF
jgi:hypothetical protein